MKNFLKLLILSLFISATTAIAQTDTMYFHKNGVVLKKVATNTFDSITYYPTAPSTIMDIDGNTYPVVTIGTQVWMAKNLATTRYNDGSPIPNVTDNAAWAALNTPAYCWYNNTMPTGSTQDYGALYNWCAVDKSRNGNKNICPTGWHVPTAAEWTTLAIYLQNNGYNHDGTIDTDNDVATNNKIAKALAKGTWQSSSIPGATGNTDYPTYQNKSGFSALSGGLRNYTNGSFSGAGGISGFWSSTCYDNYSSFFFYLNYNYHNTFIFDDNFRYGLSIRCAKD